MISMFSGLGSYSAALLLECDDTIGAVSALESSRGVISSLLIDVRQDVVALEQYDKALAAQFADISCRLDSNFDLSSQRLQQSDSLDMSSESRLTAAKEFDGYGTALSSPCAQSLVEMLTASFESAGFQLVS